MRATLKLASVVTVAAACLVAGALVGSGEVLARQPALARIVTASGEDASVNAPIVIEEVVREGDRATLRVRNRTPFIVIVYIGGVRIGWMRPYKVGKIRGLMSGHHRMYAHSRYGTTSWGPRFIWIPGTWNLLY